MDISLKNVGAIKAILADHVRSEEVQTEMNRFPSMALVGLGQGGGRMAAELARFGLPTYLFNSSKSDMDEHSKLIPEERRILTKSSEYAEIEGTSKNAALGLEIAKENKEKYKEVALKEDITNSDFVWVTVSLGGGTGNGALKVALAYLSQVRKARSLPSGKIPLGVICSIPAKNEKGSNFRKNALAGISLLQTMVNNKQIGSVLVIDNEKMYDYYAKTPLKTYGGTEIDAKSYSNMLVASLIVETGILPLLKGRSVYDKAEYLDTLSTPGWLYISKSVKQSSQDGSNDTSETTEGMIKDLFRKNEVLAVGSIEHVVTGAIGVVYPESSNVSPKFVDDVLRFTSDTLNCPVHSAIAYNSNATDITLYGLSVTVTPPSRISELKSELEEWLKTEEEQEKAQKKLVEAMEFSEFDSFLSSSSLQKRNKSIKDEFTFDEDMFDEPEQKAKTVSKEDLDNIEF